MLRLCILPGQHANWHSLIIQYPLVIFTIRFAWTDHKTSVAYQIVMYMRACSIFLDSRHEWIVKICVPFHNSIFYLQHRRKNRYWLVISTIRFARTEHKTDCGNWIQYFRFWVHDTKLKRGLSLRLSWFEVEEWWATIRSFTIMPGLNVEDLVMEGVWQVAQAGILHLWLRAYLSLLPWQRALTTHPVAQLQEAWQYLGSTKNDGLEGVGRWEATQMLCPPPGCDDR